MIRPKLPPFHRSPLLLLHISKHWVILMLKHTTAFFFIIYLWFITLCLAEFFNISCRTIGWWWLLLLFYEGEKFHSLTLYDTASDEVKQNINSWFSQLPYIDDFIIFAVVCVCFFVCSIIITASCQMKWMKSIKQQSKSDQLS